MYQYVNIKKHLLSSLYQERRVKEDSERNNLPL